MKRLIFLFLLLPFISKGQVYQSMPQAGYGPIKRILMERNGVLSIPLYTGTLGNITGGRDTGQIRYRLSDSSLYVYTGSQWIKVGGSGSATDTSSLSARINLKLSIADTASMLTNYVRLAGWGLSKTGQALRVDTTLIPSKYYLDTAKINLRAVIAASQTLQQTVDLGNTITSTGADEDLMIFYNSVLPGDTMKVHATDDGFLQIKAFGQFGLTSIFGSEGIGTNNTFTFYNGDFDGSNYNTIKSKATSNRVDTLPDASGVIALESYVNARIADSIAALKSAYGLNYTELTQIISESGGGSPTVDLEAVNTTGETFTWSSVTSGQYTITATGTPFTSGRTAVQFSIGIPGSSAGNDISYYYQITSTNTIDIFTLDTGSLADDLLDKATLTVKIYP